MKYLIVYYPDETYFKKKTLLEISQSLGGYERFKNQDRGVGVGSELRAKWLITHKGSRVT